MELKEFVANSLKEIIQGIYKVQNDEDVKKTGAVVNPDEQYGDLSKRRYIDTKIARIYIEDVNFDVAVTVTSGTETKGGIAVFGGALVLGSQGRSDFTNDVVSRLRF
jgi:hypothetical protein